jgi:dipeptidyl aminopeptidase/acylaminoacyl peptidase
MLRNKHCSLPRIAALPLAWLALALNGASAAPRTLEADDFLRVQAVESPACSADGQWIAYTVTMADRDADERRTELWMVNWQGSEHVRLVAPAAGLSAPAFSPDGRYVSYLAEHGAEGKAQIFLIDRRGGEPQAITAVSGDIGEYQWSPDGRRIVVSMSRGDEAPAADTHGAAGATAKTPKPIVVDRLHFKQDRKGYLTAGDRAQLYLLDVQTHALQPLTTDPRFDDTAPAWSPDGGQLAFVSARDGDPDRTGAQELYVIDAHPGAAPRKLAALAAPNHQQLLWMPDGRHVVLTVGQEPRLNAYMQDMLVAVSTADGSRSILAPRLDRQVSRPVAAGPDAVGVLVEDDRSQYPALVRLDAGTAQPRVSGKLLVTDQCSAAGHTAVVAATDTAAPEIHALETGGLRALSAHNAGLMAELALGAVEDISFRGAGGEEVHGLLVKPVGYQAGTLYPTLVWIHGGPNGQDGHGLDFAPYSPAFEGQWFAAHGYAVLAVNYHGSSGRGAAFASSIVGAWGHKEVADLLAAADYAVQRQIADPQRLGIGGWSYGGILTDYTIATDTRFKAAISGAGSANQLAMYGVDQYILQYNAEFGPPWKSEALWVQESYPFFHADRIRTPTLFLGGEKDFNVPVAGGEQMYAALRTLGVPTQLIVYPGQFHEIERPSYLKDRAQRYLEWFDRYLKPAKG